MHLQSGFLAKIWNGNGKTVLYIVSGKMKKWWGRKLELISVQKMKED